MQHWGGTKTENLTPPGPTASPGHGQAADPPGALERRPKRDQRERSSGVGFEASGFSVAWNYAKYGFIGCCRFLGDHGWCVGRLGCCLLNAY